MAAGSDKDVVRNEAVRGALAAALGGRPALLVDVLARLGRAEGPRPNLALAAAVGAEIAAAAGDARAAVRLLSHLGDQDAEADQPAVFLPIVAAHGWVALLRAGREQHQAWSMLAELAADGRTPVRLGTIDALLAFVTASGRVVQEARGEAARGDENSGDENSARGESANVTANARARPARPGDQLVDRALDWLGHDDREVQFGTAAAVVEVFADPRALAALARPESLLDYLSQAIGAVADAPRAAERSDARRRFLLALPRTLGAVVSHVTRGDLGVAWLETECAQARHPDVREALSNTLARFASRSAATSAVVAGRLREALEGSAKPPRDPTRRRPGTGRGKASRPVR